MLTPEEIQEFNDAVHDLKYSIGGTFAGSDGRIYWYGDSLRCLSIILRHYMKGVTVHHGYWIWKEFYGQNESWYQCSECNAYDLRETNVQSPYCWACGARMDGERKEKSADTEI